MITVAEGVNGKEKRLGKATTVTASFNPLWKQVYTLDWNKSKDQVKPITELRDKI